MRARAPLSNLLRRRPHLLRPSVQPPLTRPRIVETPSLLRAIEEPLRARMTVKVVVMLPRKAIQNSGRELRKLHAPRHRNRRPQKRENLDKHKSCSKPQISIMYPLKGRREVTIRTNWSRCLCRHRPPAIEGIRTPFKINLRVSDKVPAIDSTNSSCLLIRALSMIRVGCRVSRCLGRNRVTLTEMAMLRDKPLLHLDW